MKIKELLENADNIDEFLRNMRSIRDKYSSVDLDFIMDSDDCLSIELISLPEYLQRQGIGSEIMREITEVADKFKKSIKVQVHSFNDDYDDEISQDKLEEWYARFGFVRKGYDVSDNPVMIRLSQNQKN